MREAYHYRLRRLASIHPFESISEPEEEEINHIEPLHDALTNSHIFMIPPSEESAIKYGEAVHDILETVDLLHISLISLQHTHPFTDVLDLANNCRCVIERLSNSISDPILFAGPFAEYYLGFLRELRVNEDGGGAAAAAVANVRFAMGGGIPSVVRACEDEREKIIEAKRVFREVVGVLGKFLLVHDKTDARMLTTHPFTLKNVQTLNLVLYKLDQLDQFCRSYEEYFGHEQYRHLHNLLQHFEQRIVLRPSWEEYDRIVELWTRYERFTLHFPNQLDTMTEFFQSSGGRYVVRSIRTLSSTSSTSQEESLSVYSESEEEESLRGWRGLLYKCTIPGGRFEFVKREARRMKSWIGDRMKLFWLHRKDVD